MVQCLYLDTARLGQMSPRACRASVDLTRFANKNGPSLYFSHLLQSGFDDWPDSLKTRYRGLADWSGVATLRARLKQVTGAAPDQECLLASRSASLVKFAGRLLFGPCRNVLVTDLTWPAYGRLLAKQRVAASARCSPLAIRKRIFSERLTQAELVDVITSAYLAHGCDGLFLPLVDNFGIRLPLKGIVQRIRSLAPLRFVVVDGAQAIGHIPPELKDNICDIFIAGCHKWLRGYFPMGVGIFGRPETRGYIAASLARWKAEGWLDDPLLEFTEQLESGRWKSFGETVQLTPLFTANAACLDFQRIPQDRRDCITPTNRILLRHETIPTRWQMMEPHWELVTDIVLLKQRASKQQALPAPHLGQRWLDQSISVTALSRGLVRLSLPDSTFTDEQLHRVKQALLAI